MRNILALLAAAVLVFAGVGWYLGWYEITRTTDSDGHPNFTIDVDRQKITEDLKKGEQKLHDLISQQDKKNDAQRVTPQAPPPPPPVSSAPPPPLPTSFSTPSTVAAPGLPPPPPPPPPSTQLRVGPDGSLVLPGADSGVIPVEFTIPAPSTPSVPLPLPTKK